jgi:RHS repeat-associated protein
MATVLTEFGMVEGQDFTMESLQTPVEMGTLYPAFTSTMAKGNSTTDSPEDTPESTSLEFVCSDRQYDLYWYHPNYLGSVDLVTNKAGRVHQFFMYTAWGEAMYEYTAQSSSGSFDSPYRFNGKELDKETGYGYYGARYYQSKLSMWLSVDPLAHKYPNMSPYAFTGNNPVMLVDPDGMKIVFAPGVSEEFKAAFAQAVHHLNNHNSGNMMAQLESSKIVYYIDETTGGSFYNSDKRTISWDPNMAVVTNNAVELSPTSILNHEVDHALQHDKNPEQFKKDIRTPDSEYGNMEERRVITGSEQETAKNLGEIKNDEVTREDHLGHFYPTIGPTSIEWKYEVIAKPENNEFND